MDIQLSFLILWREIELFIEKPSDLLAKSCTWLQYKHHNTAKYLISLTPQGIISFISNGWGGRASDRKTQDTLRIYIQVTLLLLIEALMLLTQLPCLVLP